MQDIRAGLGEMHDMGALEHGLSPLCFCFPTCKVFDQSLRAPSSLLIRSLLNPPLHRLTATPMFALRTSRFTPARVRRGPESGSNSPAPDENLSVHPNFEKSSTSTHDEPFKLHLAVQCL